MKRTNLSLSFPHPLVLLLLSNSESDREYRLSPILSVNDQWSSVGCKLILIVTAQNWDYSSERMELFVFTRFDADCGNRPKLFYVGLMNMWLGTEVSSLYAIPTEWKKNPTLQTKPRRVPSLWSTIYSQVCHALIQRLSLHLTFIVEWVWFLYLAQLLISNYIKCCIIWWFRGFTCNCAIKGHEKKHKKY